MKRWWQMIWHRAGLIVAVLVLAVGWLSPAQAASQAPVTAFRTRDVVYMVAMPQSGQYVAVGSRDNDLYVLNRQGRELWKYRAGNSVSLVAVSPGGHYLAMIDQSNELYLFHGRHLLWKQSVLTNPGGLAVSRGAHLVAVSYSVVPLLDEFSQNGTKLREVPIPAGGISLSMTATGRHLALGAANDEAYLMTPSGHIVWSYATNGQVFSVAITPHGKYVAVGSQDHHVSLLTGSGQLLWKDDFHHQINGVAVSDAAHYVAVATNNSDLVLLLNHQGSVVWKTNTGDPNTSVALSGNGQLLAAGSQNHDAYLVNVSVAAAQFSAAHVQGKIVLALVVLALVGLGYWGWRKYQRSPSAQQKVALIVRHRVSYIMLIPTFGLLLLFNYYPAFSGLYHSLYRWYPGAQSYFVGLHNFFKMAQDPFLIAGIPHILIMIFFGIVLGGIGVPLLVAELMYHVRSTRMQYVYRVLFIIPLVVPAVAGILIWQNIYNPDVGLLDETLKAVGLGFLAHNWLGNPHLALASLIFMAFPFTNIIAILVFYAGLLAIPNELIEAAKLDGASLGKLIRDVHIPMLAGQFKFVLVTSVIGGLQAFGVPLVMTGGGPGDSTFVPGLEMYYAATKYNEMGYSAAISVSMFLVILGLTIIQMKYMRSSAAD